MMWPYNNDPLWHYPNCVCAQCMARRGRTWTSSETTFSYNQTHYVDSWADAIAYAIRLHLTAQASTKPIVRKLGDRWEIRWKPRYYATWNIA